METSRLKRRRTIKFLQSFDALINECFHKADAHTKTLIDSDFFLNKTPADSNQPSGYLKPIRIIDDGWVSLNQFS